MTGEEASGRACPEAKKESSVPEKIEKNEDFVAIVVGQMERAGFEVSFAHCASFLTIHFTAAGFAFDSVKLSLSVRGGCFALRLIAHLSMLTYVDGSSLRVVQTPAYLPFVGLSLVGSFFLCVS